MPNGQHFIPGVPLAGTITLTPTDIDTSQSGIELSPTRGLFFFGPSAPTILDSPDWIHLIWCSPTSYNGNTLAIQLKNWDTVLETWIPIVAVPPDASHIPPGSIPLSALQSTDFNIRMVPVVTGSGINRIVQWQTYIPIDIPIASITPGSANNIAVTNNGGTGSIWTSLASLLSALGKVVKLNNLTQSGATTDQVITWNGTTWIPKTPFTPGAPLLNSAAWNATVNWLEVYSASALGTVKMTRQNVFNTVINDFTPSVISFSTQFIGWPTVFGANTFTVQMLNDLITPGIVAAARDNNIKKFYSDQYVVNATGPAYGISALVTGVPHGLPSTPVRVGFRIARTAANGLSVSLSTGNWGVITIANGSVFDGSDVGFRTSTLSSGDQVNLYAYADATNIYIGRVVIPYGSVTTHKNIEVEILSADYSIQLYAYL